MLVFKIIMCTLALALGFNLNGQVTYVKHSFLEIEVFYGLYLSSSDIDLRNGKRFNYDFGQLRNKGFGLKGGIALNESTHLVSGVYLYRRPELKSLGGIFLPGLFGLHYWSARNYFGLLVELGLRHNLIRRKHLGFLAEFGPFIRDSPNSDYSTLGGFYCDLLFSIFINSKDSIILKAGYEGTINSYRSFSVPVSIGFQKTFF